MCGANELQYFSSDYVCLLRDVHVTLCLRSKWTQIWLDLKPFLSINIKKWKIFKCMSVKNEVENEKNLLPYDGKPFYLLIGQYEG